MMVLTVPAIVLALHKMRLKSLNLETAERSPLIQHMIKPFCFIIEANLTTNNYE